MSYYVVKDGSKTEIASFLIDINTTSEKVAINTVLTFQHSGEQWKDTGMLNKDLIPVSRSTHHGRIEHMLHYGKEVTGYYYDETIKEKTTINESVTQPYFDAYTYPYLLGMLPLKQGYKADLPVYDYKPGSTTNINLARIREVKSNRFISSLTGEHAVWQVSVTEEASGDHYEYYIDKKNRRIWKIEIHSRNENFLLIDNEIDFNPFTTNFDKQATLDMITNGNCVIRGEVFARDNENEGLLKGMAIANINRKQYAPAGTSVILIPYTPYFEEWVKLNESARKKGRAVPLSKEAAGCIKVATVYDDEGHFEFVNLMPGSYLIYTEFGYEHTTTRTEVIGYTDTYINGMFQGSAANTETSRYGVNAVASVKRTVLLERPGETMVIKLRRTR